MAFLSKCVITKSALNLICNIAGHAISIAVLFGNANPQSFNCVHIGAVRLTGFFGKINFREVEVKQILYGRNTPPEHCPGWEYNAIIVWKYNGVKSHLFYKVLSIGSIITPVNTITDEFRIFRKYKTYVLVLIITI